MGDGVFLRHEPCPSCHSKDNVAVYDNAGVILRKCMGCGWQSFEDTITLPEGLLETSPITSSVRGISPSTMRRYRYTQGTLGGKPCHVANYVTGSQTVAQKLRFPKKQFRTLGDFTNIGLYGQHLFPKHSNRVYICEGEIDTLSVAEVLGNTYAVVGLPNGAKGLKHVKANLSFVDRFEEIVLVLDNDEAGEAGAQGLITLFDPGKVKVVQWGVDDEDANQVLETKGKQYLRDLLLEQLKDFSPDGIVSLKDIDIETLVNPPEYTSYTLPYPQLDRMLGGLRKQELTTLLAGSGVGKSTLSKEITYSLLKQDAKVGYIALEENYIKSALALICLDNNVKFGNYWLDHSLISKESIAKSKEWMNNNVYFFDHFGSLDSNNLLSKLKFLASGLDVDFIVLDHISIVVSGEESDNERKAIDVLLTKLRSLIEQTGVGVLAISHIKNRTKNQAEAGGHISLNDGRGSGSIKQLSDNMIGLERNMEQDDIKDRSTVRVLKNRLLGDIGTCDNLKYSQETGRLTVDSMFTSEEEAK